MKKKKTYILSTGTYAAYIGVTRRAITKRITNNKNAGKELHSGLDHVDCIKEGPTGHYELTVIL